MRWLLRASIVVSSALTLLVTAEIVSRRLLRTPLVSGLPESASTLAVLPLLGLAFLLVAAWLTPALPSASRWRARGLVFAVYAALFASGIAVQLQLGARLQSDGFYYFAYLRSIVFDHDVDFTNDYPMLGLADKRYLIDPPTITGHAHSAWTIGPAIVWSPFFGAGHLAALRLQARGVEVAVDGSSYPYRQAICIAGLFYALLGVWFSIKAARQFFPRGIAVTGAVLVTGGSFILWYSLAEPSMTHTPTMAAVAAFLWYWTATLERRSLVHWIGLGALAGFAGMIRWQSVLFALLPAIEAAIALWRAGRTRDVPAIRATLIGGVAFTLAATIAFIPQMLAWKAIYDHYLAVSPVGPQILWRSPHLVDVLFASQNGLFALSPILYVAAIGLAIFARRRPAIGVPALVVIGVMIYFNASIQDWWGSAGYGGRRFDGTLPLFVLGAAAALETLGVLLANRPRIVAATVLAVAAVWNVTLLAAARAGTVPMGAAISFGDASAEQARLLHRWIGHPFSYPANLWFAAAYGVSPANYDLPLTSFMGDAIRPFGRIDVGGDDRAFLQAGWYPAEREGAVSYRWVTQQAGLTIPLTFATDIDLQIRVRAFALPGGPAQAVTIDTGAAKVGPLPIGTEWQTLVVAMPRGAWRAGDNRVVLTFATVGRPSSLGSADTRDLAASIDYVRVKVHD